MASRHSPILVFSTSDTFATETADYLRRVLENVGQTQSTETPQTVVELQKEDLQQPDGTQICFLYSSPETLFGQLFQQRVYDPAEFESQLQDWGKEAQKLLDLYRSDRSRAFLVETSQLRKNFAQGVAKLNMPDFDETVVAQPDWQQKEDPVLDVLMSDFVRAQPELRAICEELSASSHVLTSEKESGIPFQATQVLGRYHSQCKRAEDLEISNMLASKQNRLMIDELQQLDTGQQALSSELKEVRQRLAICEESKKRSQNQAELILKEAGSSSADEAKRYQQRIEALNNEIHRIMTSRSMKLTQPLRQLGNLLRGRR